MPLFLFIFDFYNIHTFIRRHSLKPPPYPHRLCAQWGKLPCGAEPRIELGPALLQADALPTEPRRTEDFYQYKTAIILNKKNVNSPSDWTLS